MVSTALVTVEEYLGANHKPACEYFDGVLRQKPMPTRKHGVIQGRLVRLISERFSGFEAGTEITVRLREGKFLVPDLIVQRCDQIQDPYPYSPVHLCVEILSPSDKMNEVLTKCEEYHAWGVETTWIVDPDAQRSWEYGRGLRPREVVAGGSLVAAEIVVPYTDLFSLLQH